ARRRAGAPPPRRSRPPVLRRRHGPRRRRRWPGMSAIRILIADDHEIVREGLRGMLSTQPDFEVVGLAADGEEAVSLALDLRPDVIVMDLEMPRLDGVEAIRRIRERLPDSRVLVLTAYDTDERIIDAVRAGARGYLLKGLPRQELFQGIRIV